MLKIYLVAGIRNVAATDVHGGLIANVGQTERALEERLKDPDYHRKGAGGQWITIGNGQWHVPGEFLVDRKTVADVDDEVRARLLSDNPGIVESTNNSLNTEEVIFKTDPGDGSIAELLLVEAMKAVFGRARPARPPFLPRGYQTDNLTAVEFKLKTLRRVLMSNFPGWGKSTCAPEIMHRVADKNRGNLFLFTTPITDSLDGVLDAINSVEYGDSSFFAITSEDVDSETCALINKKLTEGIHVVVLISVQGLRRGDDGTRLSKDEARTINADLREKLSFLYEIPIRLWIRDEFHKEYGGQVTKKVFEGIHPEYLLDMTATPYNLIELGEYIKDQIIGDTILNVLKKKKEGVDWYQKFPSVEIETWEGAPLNNTELGELYSDDEEWDPRKLLAIENSQLTHADAIRALNRRMYGWYRLPSGQYKEGISKQKNPFDILSDPNLSAVAKKVGLHVMAEGDSEMEANARCHLYADTLNDDPNQKMWYVAAETIKKEAKSQHKKIAEITKEYQKVATSKGRLGLVIVTHRMLLTGSDIDFLGHIVLFDRIGSLNDFVQLVGRIFRSYPEKDRVKMYVACPGMNVSVKVYEASKAEANQYGDGDPQEYYDCIPITEYDDNFKSKVVDYEEMVDRFNDHQNRILSGDWFSKNYFGRFDGLDDLVDGIDFDNLEGSGGVSTEVTGKSSAKVKKPKSKKDLEKENKDRKLGKNWKETVAVMLNESIRIGYSNDSESVRDVFDTESAAYEFGESNVCLIQTLFTSKEFFQAVDYKYRQRIAEVRDLGYE